MPNQARSLDRAVELAWGLTSRPRRPDRPGLTLERITTAAVALADAGGLDVISMARVAAELGYTTMALYRHVKSKEQLLVLMRDAASGPAPKERSAGTGWREGLRIWTESLLAVYQTHPWIVEIPIEGAPMLPNQLDWMDWALAIMAPTALTPAERINTLLLLSGFVRNEERLSLELTRSMATSGRDPATEAAHYARTLAAVVPATRMPALRALVDAGVFTDPDSDLDITGFAFSLERILDGIEGFLARRQAGTTTSSG